LEVCKNQIKSVSVHHNLKLNHGGNSTVLEVVAHIKINYLK